MAAVVLVTGCSSGFGEAIAIGMRAAGFEVVATMRDVSAASAALRASGCTIAALDVTDDASRRAVLEQVVGRFGRIDVLVNNAGITTRGSVEDTPEANLRAVMETNFFGPVALTRLVLARMRPQRSGRIVNVTAIGALLCSPFMSAYCASKHAMDALTGALDVEASALGIRTSSVLPAQFKTQISQKATHAPMTPDYAPVAETLAQGFRARAADAPADLRPVVDAVIAAATDADPKPRYVVGGGSAALLPPVVQAYEEIHRIERQRAGL